MAPVTLNGKTLLLCAEQGFGDTLMFCRYIPLIEKAGGRVILECPKEFKRLMETVEGLDQVVCPGESLPAFDTYLSLLSLPHLFRTTWDTIPASISYLKAPSQPSLKLTNKPGLEVGIVWGAGHTDVGLRNRSIELKHFLKLCEIPGVALYSLQKGPQVKQLYELGCDSLIEDLSPAIQDFADTAAILQELDLVISADTAIVHLAGALCKPVWILLPYASEWRWAMDRNDSPWYPSVKLFRLADSDDWENTFKQVQGTLEQASRVQQGDQALWVLPSS